MTDEYRVIVTARAERDLSDIRDFVSETYTETSAERLIAELAHQIRNLRTMPRRGHAREDIGPGLLMLTVRRQWSIVYRITGDQVVVSRVLRGARNLRALRF